MIAVDSVSYPYLAVAQHHGVPYSDVLKFADVIERNGLPGMTMYEPTIWESATMFAFKQEMERRRASIGL